MCTSAIADIMPTSEPIASSHTLVVIPRGIRQVRQSPPLDGCAELLSTCTGTDCVLAHDGSLLSVAVKLTMNVAPAWLELGVKEKAPLAGSKTMLGASPVAESMTVPPVPVGSVAETEKCRFVPTVAFKGPGTVMIGRTYDATTVMGTYT